MGEIIDYALKRLAERGYLDPSFPPEITDDRFGARGIRYCRLRQPGRDLHMKVGNALTEEVFEREVEAIGLVPEAVRPVLADAFSLAGDYGRPWFIVQPFYQPIAYANRRPFEQWTLVLAAADAVAGLWSRGRLHLDLNSTVFFLDPREPRVVLLDFNDVLSWPPADREAQVPQFHEGIHPDLAGPAPARPAEGAPRVLGALAERIRGMEDRFLAYAAAYLLVRAADLPHGLLEEGGAAGLASRLGVRFPVPGAVLDTVAAALAPSLAARAELDALREALCRGAHALAEPLSRSTTEPLAQACLSYLDHRVPISGGAP